MLKITHNIKTALKLKFFGIHPSKKQYCSLHEEVIN